MPAPQIGRAVTRHGARRRVACHSTSPTPPANPISQGAADPTGQTVSSVGDESTAYQALVSELAPLGARELREAAAARPEQLLDARFLFWLRDRERGRGLAAGEREAVARLGQELTAMREWREEQSNRTLLPALASSLAYTNLRRWREESGQADPVVAGGVGLEQLYRLGEEEERKLRESMERGGGEAGLGPRRAASRSSIEEFTKHNKAYADLAAGAMARVRSRLMGYDDEGPSAAEAVLRALLTQMGGAEERATFLPDAFTPPGLQIMPEATEAGGGSGKPSFVVTTPDALMAAARARLTTLGAPGGADSAPAADADASGPASAAGPSRSQTQPGSSVTVGGAAPVPGRVRWAPASSAAGPPASAAASGGASPGAPAAASRRLLPSGEDEAAALAELMELIAEYDAQVYSRKTPLERMGHSGMPW